MTKPKGLFILDPSYFDTIYGPAERRDIHALVDVPDRAYSSEEAVACPGLLQETEIIISGWGGPLLTQEFLDLVPNLKAFFYGAGTLKCTVTDAFWEKNIPITSAATANAVPVAEFAHAQIILSLKRVWWYMRELRRIEEWPPMSSSKAKVPGGYGSTVGLFSLGVIGRMVSEKLKQNELHVLAYDPFVSAEDAAQLGVELVSMEELFQRSDVVSIHAPWLKETEGIIGKRLLSLMKHEATLINTARGALINEAEMVEVLQSRPDLFVLLDVTHPEPPPKGSPLYKLPNVALTPHIAGSVTNECRRMGRLTVNEIERFLSGRPLQWQVLPEMTKVSA